MLQKYQEGGELRRAREMLKRTLKKINEGEVTREELLNCVGAKMVIANKGYRKRNRFTGRYEFVWAKLEDIY